MAVSIPNTKAVSFLHDCVTGIFRNCRTYARDNEVVTLTEQLRQQLGRPDDGFIPRWVDVLVYTIDLQFRWPEDTPDDLRRLEDFWTLYRSGADLKTCFEFYGEHINNLVLLGEEAEPTLKQLQARERPQVLIKGWEHARDEAHTRWKPAHEKMADNLTDAERADPNS